MSDYINDGSYGTEKGFPDQIQKRIDVGIGCGSGVGKRWIPLIVELDRKLNEIDPNYTIDQVKEKFGGLRFYTGAVSSEGYDLIPEAEEKSYTICEVCGEPGTCGGTGCYPTRCEKHKYCSVG